MSHGYCVPCAYSRICSNCAIACFYILGFIAGAAKQSNFIMSAHVVRGTSFITWFLGVTSPPQTQKCLWGPRARNYKRLLVLGLQVTNSEPTAQVTVVVRRQRKIPPVGGTFYDAHLLLENCTSTLRQFLSYLLVLLHWVEPTPLAVMFDADSPPDTSAFFTALARRSDSG